MTNPDEEVHLVELDLLLGGERMPLDAPYPVGDYFTLVARFDRRWDCDVYAWSVRDRLPTVPIPLLPEDGEVGVDLAAVFATTYERGRYARSLDYAAKRGKAHHRFEEVELLLPGQQAV